MRLLSDPAEWAGEYPALLAAPADDQIARRGLLRMLVARVLGRAVEEVSVLHREGRAPVLAHPTGAGLNLSSASRGDLAVLAAARIPVGVDIERVEPRIDPPWNALHPDERRWLAGLPAGARAEAFARVWAGKEAYVKMLGLGFARDPGSFELAPVDDSRVMVRDPERDGLVRVCTAWMTHAGQRFAIALAQPF